MRRPNRRPNYTKTEDIENYEIPPDYLIYKDDADTVAVNGSTGVEDSRNTDSSTVIQYAIDQLTSGGHIFIKTGRYKINTTIKLKDRIHLQGSGFATYINSNVNDMTVIGTDEAELSVCIIEDILFTHEVNREPHNYIYITTAMDECAIRNCFFHVSLYSAINLRGKIEEMMIHDNFVNGCPYGIMWVPNVSDYFAGMIYDNMVWNYTEAGIYVAGDAVHCTTPVMISNNQIIRGNIGINTSNFQHVVIQGNYIDDMITCGIQLGANSDSVKVKGNVIDNIASHSNTNDTDYAIKITNDTCQNNVIIDNELCTGDVGVIDDNGIGTIIRNNRGYVTENSGTATILNTGTDIVVAHGLAKTPTVINVTGQHAEVLDIYVGTIGAANFTITTIGGNVTADRDIFWEAKVR